MKIIYIGIPNEYTSQIDAAAAVVRRIPGVTVKTTSIYILAERELEPFTFNPLPEDVHKWISVRRDFDHAYWVRQFSIWVGSVARMNQSPYLAILFVQPEADTPIWNMMDYIYRGDLRELEQTIWSRMEVNNVGQAKAGA